MRIAYMCVCACGCIHRFLCIRGQWMQVAHCNVMGNIVVGAYSYDCRSLPFYCVFFILSLLEIVISKMQFLILGCRVMSCKLLLLHNRDYFTAMVTKWLLLKDHSVPTPLLSDSTGATSISYDSMKHEPTKHICFDVSSLRYIFGVTNVETRA